MLRAVQLEKASAKNVDSRTDFSGKLVVALLGFLNQNLTQRIELGKISVAVLEYYGTRLQFI